jgi:type II secretory pathway component PulM
MSTFSVFDPVLLPMRRRWSALSAPQQRFGAIVGALAAAIVAYAFVWLPVMREHDRLVTRLPQLQAQLVAMQSQADELRRISARPVNDARSGTAIDSAGLQAIFGSTARISAAPDRGFRVLIARMPYAHWWDRLAEAQGRHGLQLQALTLTPTADAGAAHEVTVDMLLAERAGSGAR